MLWICEYKNPDIDPQGVDLLYSCSVISVLKHSDPGLPDLRKYTFLLKFHILLAQFSILPQLAPLLQEPQ